jgi:hypothetical protein
MIIYTDVLNWYLKGNKEAYQIIEDTQGFSISVVTYMELVQGMSNKKELTTLRKALHKWDTQILYITEEVSIKAMFFVEQHFLSHSVQIADALIGATAHVHALPILTGNDKHYKAMKGLELMKFRP